MFGSVTVAIITKNREKELLRCLTSLSKQTLLPDDVLIIDNDDQHFSAKKVLNNKKLRNLKISYLNNKGTVPACRNVALAKTKTKFLAFTDDDCVLTSNWLNSGINEITRLNASYVLGNSLLFNPDSILASAQYAREDYWRKFRLKKNHTDPREVFDTKNVILNLKKIKKNKLNFDESAQLGFYDTADFSFGYQLRKKKLFGCYSEKMKLYHSETSDFNSFKEKAFSRGKLTMFIKNKLKIKKSFVNKKDKFFILWFIRSIKHGFSDLRCYSSHINGNFFKKILVVLNIKIYERFYTLGYFKND